MVYHADMITCDSWKQRPDQPKLAAYSLKVRLINLVAGSDFSQFAIFAWVYNLIYQVPVPHITKEGSHFVKRP